MPFNPIIHDLEAEQSYVTVHLRGIDIRCHYADLLINASDEEIDIWAYNKDDLIEVMRGYLEADPTLVDSQLETHCWDALEIDLVADLSKSLEMEPDTVSPVELVRMWLAEARNSDIYAVKEQELIHRLSSRLGCIRSHFEMDTTPAMLTAAFKELMSIPGAFDALSAALNEVGRANPLGVLRVAGDLARKAA
jgi:hypothetical protein